MASASSEHPGKKAKMRPAADGGGSARRNQQGQTLGRKGMQTRERLLEALERLLADRPSRELRLADICREAEVTPPTFYIYFSDINTLLLEAVQRRQVLPEALDRLLDEPWEGAEIFPKARAFVAGYMHFWEAHYHLFKMRNLVADEGDSDMVAVRWDFQVPILERIAAKIAAADTAASSPMTPIAGATVIMSSLERLAAVTRLQSSLERLAEVPQFEAGNPVRVDMSAEDIINAEAWVLAIMLGAGGGRNGAPAG
jgi:AcrR family transcriptional regulator